MIKIGSKVIINDKFCPTNENLRKTYITKVGIIKKISGVEFVVGFENLKNVICYINEITPLLPENPNECDWCDTTTNNSKEFSCGHVKRLCCDCEYIMCRSCYYSRHS